MAASRFTPVRRQYLIRTLVVTAIYLVGIFGAAYMIRDVGVARPLGIALALIPGLAIAGMFYNTLSMITATADEFMRMLAVRQQLIAAGFAFALASVWGTLEMFDLVPHAQAFYIVLLWAVGLFVGQLSNRITHGVWGECP